MFLPMLTPMDFVPKGPPGVNLEANAREAFNHLFNPWWFKAQVQKGGPWDFKTQGRQIREFWQLSLWLCGCALLSN